MTRSINCYLRSTTVVALSVVALAACTRPTAVSSTWHAPEQTAAAPFEKILVVGISDNSNQRRRFENAMAARLGTSKVRAWTSLREMGAETVLSRETVGPAVRKLDADAVLVTRLVNQEISTETVDGRTGHKTRRKTDKAIDIFRYDYDEYEEPAYIVVKNTVSLTTDLYETSDGKLLYSVDTTTYEKESGLDVIDEVAAAISKQLRKDNLIR